ncbi:hypothetical protein Lepto7376_1873 [[Leptolyngbya] sp. PCC 7376]|uniref:hypothetical protein n=1 Tax=[Leptolyngbya] sp. PCC 7376 TaxID=111781 RepID=UPI00029F2E6C|nr:hypothetical protein [[Leptolyngbya] sp. PCC 7376]AFY38193.1 hypothetical protein Lepto7376_1873 [[Leptolyngbya] sp. PCC 7376]
MQSLFRPILSVSLLCALTLVGCSSNSPSNGETSISSEPEATETQTTETETETPEAAPTEQLVLADGSVTVDLPAGWAANPGQHPFDEQSLSPDKRLGTGIRVLRLAELPEGAAPKDAYLRDIEILTSQGDYSESEAETVESLEDKTVTTTTYAGEINGLAAYYKFALIEFTEDPDLFLVMVQGGAPTDWATANEILMEINRSATIATAE